MTKDKRLIIQECKEAAYDICKDFFWAKKLDENEKAVLLKDYSEKADEFFPKIAGYTNLSAKKPLIEIVDSYDWIDKNMDNNLFFELFDYGNLYSNKESFFLEKLLSRVVGAQYALLSTLVLGQYDSNLFETKIIPGKIYFVHPNIEKISKKNEIDINEFINMIAAHELTHNFQFTNQLSENWLKSYIESKIDEFIDKSFKSFMKNKKSIKNIF